MASGPEDCRACTSQSRAAAQVLDQLSPGDACCLRHPVQRFSLAFAEVDIGPLHTPLMRSGRTLEAGKQPCDQPSRARMSSASMVVPNAFPSSSTLENSLAFLAFSAMTLSSMVSLATRR
jgi:hypothetical protein